MTQIAFNENIAREITAGCRLGKIMTRDGFPVKILHWGAKSAFPIVGLVDLGDHEYAKQWTVTGKGDTRNNVTLSSDLILEVEGGEV